MKFKPEGPFTTGHLAKMFDVAPRTISKWIDDNIIRGYRIPGSADRRVKREEIVAFLKRNPTVPVPRELCHVPLTFDLCRRYLELMPKHWIGTATFERVGINNVIDVYPKDVGYIVHVMNVRLEGADIPQTLYGFIRLCTLHIDGPEVEPQWVVI